MPLSSETSYDRLLFSFRDVGTLAFAVRYIGLCTGDPGDSQTATANEVTDGWYGRRDLGGGTAAYIYTTTPNGFVQQNVSQATWTPTTVVTITHIVMDLSNAISGGHEWYAQLNYPITTIASVPIYVRATTGLQADVTTDFFCTGPNARKTLGIFTPFASGVQMWSSPSTQKYLGLSETIPTRDGGNITELVGNNYARTQVDGDNFSIELNGGPTYGLLGSCARLNAQRNFPTATADWNTVTGWFLSTVSTGGTASNIYACGALDSAVTVKSGEHPEFRSTELVVAVY